MKPGIQVNVSGGSAAFGNIAQGDGNTLHADHVGARSASPFDDLIARLPELARPFDRSDNEVARLREQIASLRAEAESATPDVARGHGLLRTIHDNFSWAWPVVKDVVSLAWPTVVAALAL